MFHNFGDFLISVLLHIFKFFFSLLFLLFFFFMWRIFRWNLILYLYDFKERYIITLCDFNYFRPYLHCLVFNLFIYSYFYLYFIITVLTLLVTSILHLFVFIFIYLFSDYLFIILFSVIKYFNYGKYIQAFVS